MSNRSYTGGAENLPSGDALRPLQPRDRPSISRSRSVELSVSLEAQNVGNDIGVSTSITLPRIDYPDLHRRGSHQNLAIVTQSRN